MATTTTLSQTVTSGIREYFGQLTPSAINDTFEFQFEEGMTIEDIVIEMSASTDDWELNIVYPSSNITAQITSSTGGSWTLNDYSREKQWFRIPAKAILQWKVTTAPSESVTMLVLGLG